MHPVQSQYITRNFQQTSLEASLNQLHLEGYDILSVTPVGVYFDSNGAAKISYCSVVGRLRQEEPVVVKVKPPVRRSTKTNGGV